MSKNGKSTIINPREQLAISNARLEQEISRRRQAEDRVAALTAELTASKNQLASFEKTMAERIRFDVLLSEISAHFINLSPDQIDKEIEDAQRRICECLGIPMSVLWQWEPENPGEFVLTHLYRPMGGPAVPERMAASQHFPWSLQQIVAGKTIVISSIEKNVPPEAASQVEIWRYYGIKAMLGIPLIAGSGSCLGGISFQDTQAERNWSETLVKRLQLVAQIFANALARKRSDEILRESELRLSLATEAAGAGLWSMYLNTEKVWVSEKLRELFHFATDEDVTYQRFLGKIHPDDSDRVRRAIEATIHSGENLHVDYRIFLPDGAIRWICSRGNRYGKTEGKPDRLMGVSVDNTERMTLENELREHVQHIEALKHRLENENLYLQREINFLGDPGNIVGRSLAIKRILVEAEQVAATDSTVLILGETGTGKEMLARAIHRMSGRKDRPMITINCASLPPTLIESELFGREKGAYTGALTKMAGRFEIADGSTLFLDEIGELPLELQSKLLRILEEGVFERLGSTKPLRVNVRIIAATNRDLDAEVAQGRFRKDLFYRLSVFPLVIPPLRERTEDIPLLTWAFIKEFQQRMGKEIETVSKKTMASLQSYSWPGNVRELRNVIEHAMILSTNAAILIHLPKAGVKEKDDPHNLDDVERQHITAVLERTGWRVGAAAGILGLKRSTLYSRMKKLGIVRPGF